MITRMQMPRQLRNKGGITNAVPREKYGLGSKIKDRFRKLIPNELADVAVAAAPFVAPFNPGIAGLMRGIGRFDQRGSISDALKQGFATAAFGKLAGEIPGTQDYFGKGMEGARKLAGDVRTKAGRLFQGKTPGSDIGFTSPLNAERTQAVKSLFKGGEKQNEKIVEKLGTKKTEGLDVVREASDKVFSKIPGADKLPSMVKQKLLVGGITSAGTALYEYFTGGFEPPEPGESMEEYMTRRRERVKSQMRQVMDSYYTPLRNPEYAAMSDEQKDNFIDGIVGSGMATGGRVGYQTGGVTMANTLAENIRRNVANQAAFQQLIAPAQEKARQKAFNVFMTPKGTVAKDQGIAQLARDTGKAPSITNLPITSGTDISRMIGPGTGIGEGKTSYSGAQQFSNLGFAALPSSGQTTTTTPTTVSQTNTAPDLTKQSEAYGRLMQQKFEEAYGNPEDYRAEAATLGMPLGVYMDYLMTFDPKDVSYSLRKQDPYYDPQFDMPRVPEEKAELDPLRIYFNRELQRQIDAGIPESERIKFGQVIAPVTTLPSSGTMPSMYESYEDALARTRKQMGLAKGGMPTGIMRTNKAGVIERDYRDKGGFVPVGIKEKADDVPAMLSKNEFVFTADAVRGAGGGSIEKGAQRMYNTMKNLEKRVV